jgi:hypothetical protein
MMIKWLSVLLLLWPAVATAQAPARMTERAAQVPDVLQTDPRGEFVRGGMWYCAPAAVANGLYWLATRGRADLVERGPDPTEVQLRLVRDLASPEYLDTNLTRGTGAGLLLQGVARYLRSRGYDDFEMSYQGWRLHPRHFSAGQRKPQLAWIKEGLQREGVVWLNLGWYRHDPATDRWTRLGGHWVTVVGYGVDQRGDPAPDVLWLHDPAPRAGLSPATERVRFEALPGGWLVGRKAGLPLPAAGYYVTGQGMHVRHGATAAILDGAVRLRLH